MVLNIKRLASGGATIAGVMFILMACPAEKKTFDRKPIESASLDKSDFTPHRMFVFAEEGLALRTKPSREGDIISIIQHQAEVNTLAVSGPEQVIDGARGKWTKISCDGKEGWVFGGFLSYQKETAPSLLRSHFVFRGASPRKDIVIPFIYNIPTDFYPFSDELPMTEHGIEYGDGDIRIYFRENYLIRDDLRITASAPSVKAAITVTKGKMQKDVFGERGFIDVRFRNYYWFKTGSWYFQVTSGDETLVGKSLSIDPLDEFIAVPGRCNDPFKDILVDEFIPETDYQYIFPADEKDTVVVFFSGGGDPYIYYSFLVVTVTGQMDGYRNFVFHLKKNAPKGWYVLRRYHVGEIPRIRQDQAIFDFHRLQ